MLIPKINPDEFGPGYMIRLGLINGYKTYQSTIDFILNCYPEFKNFTDLLGLQLATILNMDVEEFCQQHSLLPVFRCITNIEDETAHGSMKYPYAIRRYAHFGMSQTMKLCNECVKEDLDYLGYSYYRRSHQLPGVTRCQKHQNQGPLHSVPNKQFCNPDIAVNQSTPEKEFDNNVVIERYLNILDGVCDIKKPIDPNKLVNSLQNAAKKKNLKWYLNGRNLFLSDYALNELPVEWVSLIIPTFKSKSLSVRFSSLDGVLSPQAQSFKSINYILVLALLFDDADDALFLLKKSLHLNPKKISTLKEKRLNLAQFDLEKEFFANDGCGEKIARKLGVNYDHLRIEYQKLKLPFIGHKIKSTFNAYDSFMNGASLDESAKKSGLEIEQLENIIRKLCIKFDLMKTFDTQLRTNQ